MAEETHLVSKELSPEGRKQLCATLGLNMLAYRVQADWLFNQLQEKKDANLDVLFRITIISMDLCASIRACLRYESSYERRYHIKYLIVNLYEAYCAFYNEASDGKSYIAKWERRNLSVKDYEVYVALCKELEGLRVQLHDNIKDSRNSFAHFDDDPIDTAKFILGIDSEEKPTRWCCDLLKVFEMMKKVCEKRHKFVIDASVPPISLETIIVGLVRNQLRSNKNLIGCIKVVAEKAEKHLRKYICSFEFIKKFGDNNQEIVLLLMRIHVLIQIMRADLASAVKACLYADSDMECVMQIRRLVIIRQEGVGHLQDLWNQLPEALVDKEDNEHLNAIQNEVVNRERNKLLHYRYKSSDYTKFCYAYCSQSLNLVNGLMDVIPLLNEINALEWSLTRKLQKVRSENLQNLSQEFAKRLILITK